MTGKDAYKALKKHLREHAHLDSFLGLAEWDQETYMPAGAGDTRAEMIGLMARLAHEMFTDQKVGDWIAACEQSEIVAQADSVEAANIRELRRMYNRRTKLPKEFVEEEARTTAKAQQVWVVARKKSDFAMFAPTLEKVFEITHRKAEYYGYEGEAYNALIEDFEPGTTVDEVATVFDGLRPELVELVGRIANAPRRPDIKIIKQPYDIPKQRLFSQMVAATIGYDFKHGRIDEVAHPFCTGFGPGDTRICTRFYPDDLAEGLTGTTHEAGHALYDMGMNQEQFGMPCGEAQSLGLHESQSRMWENQVGRSRAFWNYFFPIAQRIFHDELGSVTLDQMYHAMNHVAPSYIRVEADEATYNLHIMLRFELERNLLSGEIKVADLPSEWNRRFKEYFGIEVDKDSNGCLQDTHWAMGAIGYFPTYTLGNLYSAQFYAAARKALPQMDSQFSTGDFSGLLGWLRENIHQHGARYRAADICLRTTGEKLSHRPLIDYLKDKYKEIYGI